MFISVFKQLNIVNNICEPEKNVFYFKICISLSSTVYLVLQTLTTISTGKVESRYKYWRGNDVSYKYTNL